MYPTLSKKQFLYWLLLAVLVQIFSSTNATAQASSPFITRWDLSKTGSGTTSLSFGVATSGTVSYTWQQVGGSNLSGSGTFTGTTAAITGLPAGAVIDLSINPTNFQRIKINNGTDRNRLTQIKQWGTVAWTNMESAFFGCENMTLTATDNPNTAAVTDMSSMFSHCRAFNQALPANFNTAAVTNMSGMFFSCNTYNQALPANLNTAKVTNMNYMFGFCDAYNQALPANLNTAAVTNMSNMFAYCSVYNKALPTSFNTAAVTNMSAMFYRCSAYNQALPANFNTAKVTDMSYMFSDCNAFNQNVGNFNIALATTMTNIFTNSGISIANYDAILTAWNTAGYTNKNLGNVLPLKYCAAATARNTMITAKGWTITGDVSGCTTTTLSSSQNPSLSGNNVTFTATVSPNTATGTVTFKDGTTTLGTGILSAGVATFATTTLPAGTRSITAVYEGNATNATSTSAVLSQVVTLGPNSFFITRWDLSKSTGSGTTQLSFGVATSGTVSYTWQEVGGSGLSGSGTFTGTTAAITGLPAGAVIDLSIDPTNFQLISINDGTDKSRLTQLRQWGTVAWTSMLNAFNGCNNFTLVATDVPNLTGVTNMNNMFRNCSSFNQPLLEGFNTATVTNMNGMFSGCTLYNQALPSTFSTAAVTNMSLMFRLCGAYNQALPSSFNTSAVRDMSFMFSGCSSYNQDFPSGFNTAAVTNMGQMFTGCSSFNKPFPSNFNTAAVTDMNFMFSGCRAYNQVFPSSFNTAAVTNMDGFLAGCSIYNQPFLSSFTTGAVTRMFLMFSGCTAFNQNVGNFNISAVTNMTDIFKNSGISIVNYDAILTAWNTAGYTNKNLGDASPLQYCTAAAARNTLITTKGWTITGDKACTTTTLSSSQNPATFSSSVTFTATVSPSTATGTVTFKDGTATLGTGTLSAGVATFATTTLPVGTRSITAVYQGDAINGTSTSAVLSQVVNPPLTTPFITTWKVANSNIIIPTNSASGTYNYTVNYKKKGTTTYTTLNSQTGNCTISGLTDGDTIQVEITGIFPHFYMNNNPTEKTKLLSIDAWGNQNWRSMSYSFWGCSNLTYSAIDNPDLSSVTNMRYMFLSCSKFNGNIGAWNTSNVTDMSGVFADAIIFNQNIGSWNTANVTTMYQMFQGASKFNQNIGNWEMSKVTNMGAMFAAAVEFNQDLNQWNTVNATSMTSIFVNAKKFNQPLNNWKTAKLTDTFAMFTNASSFNQDLSQWNVDNVTLMANMFLGATKFNQPLTNWNTIKVTDMSFMFNGATAFNQDLSVLKINAVTNMSNMLNNAGLSLANYDATLTGWLSQNKTGLNLGASGLTYCTAEAARTSLITPIASGGKGWTITDGGKACAATTPFITTWKVANGNIIIPTLNTSGRYDYTVNYKKKGTTTYTTLSNQTENCTISGLTDGDTIQVEITGLFPHFFMNNNPTEKTKLLSIDAWGNQNWKSMTNAFWGCSNLTYNATDNPDLSAVTSLRFMFIFCSKFNGNIGSWNTSNITDMVGVFAGATIFNQDISSWNTSNVTDMYQMFQEATKFNQNISSWNTGKMINMSQMFHGAYEFNQDLSQWNTSNVINMRGMFAFASKFNKPLNNWNTEKVTDMVVMFYNASEFNQDLSGLEINAVTDMISMLDFSGLSIANYDATLTGWLSQNKTGLRLGALGLKYCAAEAARTTLVTPIASGGKGWIITDGGKTCAPPAPTASAQSHCQGKTVADLVATGQNIQWYNTSTGGTALTNTTVLTAGTYYASQTVSGIESARTSADVTVNPLTTATVTLSPNVICSGSSGMLTATVTNQGTGFSSVWRINGTDQNVTGLSIGYNASPGEVYSLSLTPAANACPSVATVTASITVTPRTAPVLTIKPNIICEGSNETLNVSSSSNLGTNPIYTWRLNGTTVGNSSTLAINNAVLNDVYSISVSPDFDAPGCLMMGTQTITVGCIRSIVSGNWEDPATWNLNRVPTATDNAVIDANHNVTITTDGANANKADMRTNSKLIYGNTSAKLKLGF